jgi:hypothetical protein
MCVHRVLRTLGLALAFLLIATAPALAAKGEVVYRQSGCDYFVVSTVTGYDLLERYGGYDPDKGHARW